MRRPTNRYQAAHDFSRWESQVAGDRPGMERSTWDDDDAGARFFYVLGVAALISAPVWTVLVVAGLWAL